MRLGNAQKSSPVGRQWGGGSGMYKHHKNDSLKIDPKLEHQSDRLRALTTFREWGEGGGGMLEGTG